jgi:prophage tail gpP-like protein
MVGDTKLGGWTSVKVTKGMDCLCGTFNLALSAKYNGRGQAYKFDTNSKCTVSLDGVRIITGYVDDVAINYGTDSHDLSISGRDLTGDLVDCSHVPKANSEAFNGLDLVDIASILCDPFGIDVSAEVDVGKPFPTVKINEGESVFSLIDRLAKARQVLPVSNGDGSLVFTRAGAGRSAGTIELGGNATSGDTQQSNMERFSLYMVKGQSTTDQVPQEADQAAVPEHPSKMSEEEYQARQDAQIRAHGKAEDSAIKRYRPLVVVADTAANPEKMQAIANYQAMVRAGRSRQSSYTVSGWGPQTGGLWEFNTLVRVVDGYLGLDDYLLIQSVEYTQDESGTTSKVVLVDPRSYALDPASNDEAGDIKGAND